VWTAAQYIYLQVNDVTYEPNVYLNSVDSSYNCYDPGTWAVDYQLGVKQ